MEAMDVDHVPAESFTSWFDYLTLESFLGAGSFGYVFRAVSGQVNQSAVKVIFVDTMGKTLEDETQKLRLSREYKLMRGKKHNNLVEILKSTDRPFMVKDVNALLEIPCLQNYEDVLDQLNTLSMRAKRRTQIPTLCIQMELCGKTLRHWLNLHNEMDDPELHPVRNRIIRDMYEGLKFLYNHNIMHRDFRPENIMFSFSLTGEQFAFPVKVGDFDQCRQIHSEQTATKTLTPEVGNAIYRAPEANSVNYGIPADLFSFGLVSWEVLQPIKQKDTRSMFHRLVHDSKINLVKGADWWLENWRDVIIKLTKRRLQNRIKGHDEVRLVYLDNISAPDTVLQEDISDILQLHYMHGLLSIGEMTIESTEQFVILNKFLKIGTIVNINLNDHALLEYTCYVDNVTFRGVNTSAHQNLSLRIQAKFCTINNLNLNSLCIGGSDNSVSNVICDDLSVIGSKNSVENVEALHRCNDDIESKSGFSVYGEQHILKSIKCCRVNSQGGNPRTDYDYDERRLDFSLQFGRICLNLFNVSESCTIANAMIHNAFVGGTGHTLKDIMCNNAIGLDGSDHYTENLDALHLIEYSTITE